MDDWMKAANPQPHSGDDLSENGRADKLQGKELRIDEPDESRKAEPGEKHVEDKKLRDPRLNGGPWLPEAAEASVVSKSGAEQ